MNSSHWLISRNQDLTWFLGGASIGYLILAAIALGAPVTPFNYLMVFALESPHVFATVTRSYLDSESRRKLGPFLLLVVPLCLFGILMVWAGWGKKFYMFAVLWLHIHIAKQHVGFVMLYKRKANEKDSILLDKYFLLGSLTAPVVLFIFRTVLPVYAIVMAIGIQVAAAIWYGLREGERPSVVTPKLILMASVIPLQWLAFGVAAISGGGSRVAGIAIVSGHALQYRRMVRLYHKADRFSSPPKMWHSLGGYLIIILSLNLIFYAIPVLAIGTDTIIAGVWGLSFMHYIIDGKIWKTSDNPVFRKALGFAG